MANRTVIIAGATGLVGREILNGLLADESVVEVHSLGRRAPAIRHPKLTTHVVDFAALSSLPPADEVYLALGTTIKVAGNQAAFRAIDYDANLAVATSALVADVKKAGLVSAMGADPNSKGEKLGFALGKALGFLIPPNYKPIEATAVAKALLYAVPSAKGKTILLSGSMR
ncbi:nucleoside-diphosphate sugar epimerase [Cupriavidus necator]